MLETKLTYDVRYKASALTIESGEKALVCFEEEFPHSHCDIFDGESIQITFSSNFPHQGGGLAFFRGNPTAVGSSHREGRKKVETLLKNNWISLPDQPEYSFLR